MILINELRWAATQARVASGASLDDRINRRSTRNVAICLFALILFAIQDLALAGEPSTLAGASSCDSKLPNNDLTECLKAVAKKQDLVLERYVEAKRIDIRKYAADVRKIEPDRADSTRELEDAVRGLERAQTSWVAYREAHCGMIGRLYLDGTGGGAAELKCSINLTMVRIRELWVGPRSGLPDPN